MRPKKVLIADDDSTLTRLLQVRFRHLGCEARGVYDAMQALTCIHRDPPDLIVMDVRMPAGNGLAAVEMLSNDPRLCDIPVIIITGRADEVTRIRCRALGADFVIKSGDIWQRLKPLALQRLHLEEQLV